MRRQNKTLNHITANSAFVNKLGVSDTDAVNNQSMEDRVSAGVTRVRSLMLTLSTNANSNGIIVSFPPAPTTLPVSCTLRRVDFAIQFAPTADTFTFEIFKNGVGTGVTLNHTGASIDVPWPGLSVSFAEGDAFAIYFFTTGGGAGRVNLSALFEY